MITPDASQPEEERYAKAVAQGQRVQGEGVRQSTDGLLLVFAILRVPVSMPGGEIDLLAALRWIAGQFSRRTGIPATVQGPRDLARFAPELEIGLYRIVLEALTNVTKHARANHVTISLSMQEQQLELVVADDARDSIRALFQDAAVPADGA